MGKITWIGILLILAGIASYYFELLSPTISIVGGVVGIVLLLIGLRKGKRY
jgi:membrane-bound ClpP family serine protease